MKRLNRAQIDEMRQKFEVIRQVNGETVSQFDKVENALLKGADPQEVLNMVRTIPRGFPANDWELEGVLSTFFLDEEYKYVVEKIVNFEVLIYMHRALRQGLDIECMVNPSLNLEQIFQVYLGLSEGLDASAYAKPELNSEKMEVIREGMSRYYINDNDIAEILNNNYTTHQIFKKFIYPKQDTEVSKKMQKIMKKWS